MSLKYQLLESGEYKICEKVLRSLPGWFGIEESTLAYIEQSKKLPMVIATDGETPIGFLSLKEHSEYTHEIYVMGVLPDYHSKGIGRQLVAKAEEFLANTETEFLQVKTVSEERECEFYKKTRLFYKSMGFKEVEIFPTLWGEANPCQLLIKNIEKNDDNFDRVIISPYNKQWPKQFEQIKELLLSAIGDLVISIDHIGSTSVPGLGAKDRIDVQITVKEISNDFKKRLDDKLTKAQFQESKDFGDHRPPGDDSPDSDWKKLYITGTHPALEFKSNIHVRALGRANQEYPLLFRDYLRDDEPAMKAYEMLKKELSRFHPFNRIAYCEIKDPACDLIMLNARKWAQDTSWSIDKIIPMS